MYLQPGIQFASCVLFIRCVHFVCYGLYILNVRYLTSRKYLDFFLTVDMQVLVNNLALCLFMLAVLSTLFIWHSIMIEYASEICLPAKLHRTLYKAEHFSSCQDISFLALFNESQNLLRVSVNEVIDMRC